MNCIITVLGKDKIGIIGKVCTLLSEKSVNILDIQQTIIKDYFNMIMIVDISKSTESFEDLAKSLQAAGEEIEVQIKIQLESIFDCMHRIWLSGGRPWFQQEKY